MAGEGGQLSGADQRLAGLYALWTGASGVGIRVQIFWSARLVSRVGDPIAADAGGGWLVDQSRHDAAALAGGGARGDDRDGLFAAISGPRAASDHHEQTALRRRLGESAKGCGEFGALREQRIGAAAELAGDSD